MQLNEIIEENTLPTISRRTRISVENLEAVFHRDWSRLKKVQAMGFISILEREYQADLSDLKADCRAYFAEVGPLEEAEPLVVTPMEKENGGKLFRVLVLILLLIAAYGSWRYLSAPMSGESNATSSTPAKKEGSFFDSVLSMTEGWFTENDQGSGEQEVAVEEPPVTQGAWAEENDSEKNRTSQSAESSQENAAEGESATADSNTASFGAGASEETEEAKIITQVKKEQAKAEKLRQQSVQEPTAQPAEENLSDVSRMILAATAGGSEESPQKEQGALAPTVPSMDQKSDTATATAGKTGKESSTAEASAEAAASQAPAATVQETVVQQQPAVTDTLVVFHPRSKVWIGYTDLRTMKRTTKVTADDITFDTSKGDYILATGHGMVEFKGKNTLKLNDGSRHFFKIAQGEVREISHEEFQRLNKSKVW